MVGRLKELASENRRYGYLRLHAMLRREGLVANRKRTYRLYTEQGLQVRTKKRRKLPRRDRIAPQVPERPMQRWSLDFRVNLMGRAGSIATGRASRGDRGARGVPGQDFCNQRRMVRDDGGSMPSVASRSATSSASRAALIFGRRPLISSAMPVATARARAWRLRRGLAAALSGAGARHAMPERHCGDRHRLRLDRPAHGLGVEHGVGLDEHRQFLGVSALDGVLGHEPLGASDAGHEDEAVADPGDHSAATSIGLRCRTSARSGCSGGTCSSRGGRTRGSPARWCSPPRRAASSRRDGGREGGDC